MPHPLFHRVTKIRSASLTRGIIDALESRRMLAINATFLPGTGVLSVTGDSVANSIEISRNAAGTILVNAGAVAVSGGTPTVANTTLVQVFGNAGNDSIIFNEASGALPAAQIQGGSENDTITGGSGSDFLFGQDGNDILNGKGGFDNLFGGNGDDTLTGGDADDTIFGEIGNDRMIWNPGDDTDVNEGGDGLDTTEVNGGNGTETFTLTPNGTRVRFDRVAPAPFFLNINETETLQLNANGGDDIVSVANGLATLISFAANGGTGNDTITGGDGNETLSGDDGNDFIDGNGGNDVVFLGIGTDLFQWDPGDGSDTIEGQADADQLNFNGSVSGETITISASGPRVRLIRDVGAVTMDMDGIETMQLNPLGGADLVSVNDLSGTAVTSVDLNLSGTIGGATSDGQADKVSLEGTASSDNVQINSAGGSLIPTGLAVPVTIDQLDATDGLTLNTLGLDDIITVNSVIGPMTILSGSGNDTINVLDSTNFVTVNTGSEVVSGVAPFGDSIQVNSDFPVPGDTPAKIAIEQDDTVMDLTVSQSGILRIASGAVLAEAGGAVNITGTVDLAGGALLHRAGGLPPDYRALLIRGYNGGAWNGTSTSGAINSSLGGRSLVTLGYGLGSQIAPTTIGSFSINAGDTLLRYTLDGDADLNTTVNASDLGILSANWQGSGKVFAKADFNYDGKVDLLDLYKLGINFNQTLPPPAIAISLPAASSGTVPRRSATRTIELVSI